MTHDEFLHLAEVHNERTNGALRLEIHTLKQRLDNLQSMVKSYQQERMKICCALNGIGLLLQPDGSILYKVPNDQAPETSSLSPLLPAR